MDIILHPAAADSLTFISFYLAYNLSISLNYQLYLAYSLSHEPSAHESSSERI
jgi:hypothetical protein